MRLMYCNFSLRLFGRKIKKIVEMNDFSKSEFQKKIPFAVTNGILDGVVRINLSAKLVLRSLLMDLLLQILRYLYKEILQLLLLFVLFHHV